VNSRRFFCVVVFCIINFVFSVQAVDSSCSLLLFGVQHNHIMITRYKVGNVTDNKLGIDKGHLIFDLDLNETGLSIDTLIFNPNNYRELLFMAQVDKWVVPFIFSWSSLITQCKKSFNRCDILHFTVSSTRIVKGDKVKGCFLTGQLGEDGDQHAVEIVSEQCYKSVCGIFLPDDMFSYDSGMFTRTLTKSQVDALGVILPYKKSEITYLLCAGFCRFFQAHYKNLRHWGAKGSRKTKKIYEKIKLFCAAKFAYFKSVLSLEKQGKNLVGDSEKEVKESLFEEQDLDCLLEEAMNDDLSFISDQVKADPAIIVFGKKVGVAIFLKYLALEKKMKELMGWASAKISGNK